MGKKITWGVIFEDFKSRHPKFGKQVLDYRPYDYATILLYFKENVRMTYNYDTKELTKMSYNYDIKRLVKAD